MPTTVLLRPDFLTARTGTDEAPATGRLAVGGRLALVDNGKPNAGVFLDVLANLMQAQLKPSAVVRVRKSSAGESIRAEHLEQLDGTDLALTGFGDCGSCTSWTVRDAAAIIELGIPTIVVVTTPFLPLAQVVGTSLGMPEDVFLELPHPVNILDRASLEELGATVLPRVLQMTGQAAGPAHDHD